MEWFASLDHVCQALIATVFTWGVTAAGASFVFFFKHIHKNVLDAMLGLSAGVMIAASFFSLLLPASQMCESLSLSPYLTLLAGFITGGAVLFAGDKIFSLLEKKTSGASPGKSRKRSMMLIFSITLHNIPEGLCVGVAFGSLKYGLDGATLASASLLALGIGLQNFPEGTAVSVPLRREGFSRGKSFFWGQISGIVEPISGVIGAILVTGARSLLPFFLSFAAGAMIYVVVEELIPESQTNEKKDVMALFTLFGFSLMMLLDMVFS
ncbi:MAG: ZIP family metal transporter [Eubacteriales bacterium]